MTFRLERLVYQSTATGSTGSLLNIATILAESQRNNDARGLTGALAAEFTRAVDAVIADAKETDLFACSPDRLGDIALRGGIALEERAEIDQRNLVRAHAADAQIFRQNRRRANRRHDRLLPSGPVRAGPPIAPRNDVSGPRPQGPPPAQPAN